MQHKQYNKKPRKEVSVYQGYIVKADDPLGMGRYAVYSPELFPKVQPGTKYIFAKNVVSNYVKSRNPMTMEYVEYGQYTPLQEGTGVYFMVPGNNFDQALIFAVDSVVGTPKKSRDNYYQIYKTRFGSQMYVDDEKGIFHIQHEQGKSNVYMTDKTIMLQLNTERSGGGSQSYQRKSAIVLDENKVQFIVGGAVYEFNEDGFNMNMGNNALTYFNFSRDGVNIQGNKYVNISAENGALHLFAEKTHITGYNELHAYGNDLRLTGTQKAQLTGTHVNIDSWLDTHVKGMNVNIEASLTFMKQSTFSDEKSFGALNIFSPMINQTSSVSALSTMVNAVSTPFNAFDGMTLTNMGAGANIAENVGTSISTLAVTLKTAFMGIGTALLINEPTGIMAAVNMVLTETKAGTGAPASGAVLIPGAIYPENDPVSGQVNYNLFQDADTKKYIQPPRISTQVTY